MLNFFLHIAMYNIILAVLSEQVIAKYFWYMKQFCRERQM